MYYKPSKESLVIETKELQQIKALHAFKSPQVLINIRKPNKPHEGFYVVITPTEYHMPTFLLDSYEPQLKLVQTVKVVQEWIPDADYVAAYINLRNLIDTDDWAFFNEHRTWTIEKVTSELILFKEDAQNA